MQMSGIPFGTTDWSQIEATEHKGITGVACWRTRSFDGIRVRIHHFANLGYWVRSSRVRNGIASAAVRMVARYGFDRLGLARIEILAQVPNVASRRVAEKAGGRLEGIARNRLAFGNRHFDAALYSLLPGDLDAAG